MDYLIGFLLGYFLKETLGFIKRISEYDWDNRMSYEREWDFLVTEMTFHNDKLKSNDFTQKELLKLVIDRLDRLEEKLDNKLDKSEFYKVLGLVATVILIVGSLSM